MSEQYNRRIVLMDRPSQSTNTSLPFPSEPFSGQTCPRPLSPVQAILAQAKAVADIKSKGLTHNPNGKPSPFRITLEVYGNEIVLNGQSYRAKNHDWNEQDFNKLVSRLFAQLIDKDHPIELTTESLNISRPSAVSALYAGKQCDICSIRFQDKDKYAKHLDWHIMEHKRDIKDIVSKIKSVKCNSKTRQWYLSMDQWLEFNEITDEDSSGHTQHLTSDLKKEEISTDVSFLKDLIVQKERTAKKESNDNCEDNPTAIQDFDGTAESGDDSNLRKR